MPFSRNVLAEFEQEWPNTRKMIALVPDDKLDYRPHEKSMTLGRLAAHVVEMSQYGLTTCTANRYQIPAGQMPPFVNQTREELLKTLDENLAKCRAAIESLSDEAWQETWTLTWGDQTIFSMPRIACWRGMVMNHMIHHRAQLGVYLRMNNVEIPGMYGPSADEMKFWAQNA